MIPTSKPSISVSKDDFHYLLELVNHLNGSYNIYFFITPRDFDILYRWWEKGIPLKIIKEAMDKVVERWRKKGKEIQGFTNFYYEVKKSFQMFCELRVGDRVLEGDAQRESEDDLKAFMDHYPPELSDVKHIFQDFYARRAGITDQTLDKLWNEILAVFKNDTELVTRSRIFMKNISRELQSAELERRFRINYLINRFNIPDLEAKKD